MKFISSIYIIIFCLSFKHSYSASISTELSYYNNLTSEDTVDQSSELYLIFTPSHHFNKNLILHAEFSGAKDLKGLREVEIDNGFLGLDYNFFNYDNIVSWATSAKIYVPLNKRSRKDQGLITKIEIDFPGAWGLTHFGLPGLELTYKPWVTRGIYSFEDSRLEGNPNIRWRLGQKLGLSYQFSQKFMANIIFGYTYDWSFNSTRLSDNFYDQQEIVYYYNQTLSLALGHINRGDAVKANGTESNLSLFNTNNSQFYSSLKFDF